MTISPIVKYFRFYEADNQINRRGYRVDLFAYKVDTRALAIPTNEVGLRIDIVVYNKTQKIKATETVHVYRDTEHDAGLSLIQTAVDDSINEIKAVSA